LPPVLTNHMVVNIEKTNIVHFRKKRCNLTNVEFRLGNKIVKKVKEYKYLGVLLDEFMNFNATVDLLSGAAGRALGAIINKFKSHRNSSYNAFSKLFHSNVCPILDYCSGVWGYKNFQACEKIQYRAQRWYLGVHNKTPLLAIAGDMGWADSLTRRHTDMLRLWNRLIKLPDNRITKKILWDKNKCNKNWMERRQRI